MPICSLVDALFLFLPASLLMSTPAAFTGAGCATAHSAASFFCAQRGFCLVAVVLFCCSEGLADLSSLTRDGTLPVTVCWPLADGAGAAPLPTPRTHGQRIPKDST